MRNVMKDTVTILSVLSIDTMFFPHISTGSDSKKC